MKAAVLAFLAIAILTAAWFLLLTPDGGLFISRMLLHRYLGPHTVTVSRAEGSVLTGLQLQDLRVHQLPKELKELSGASLWIRGLSLKLPLRHKGRFQVSVHSAQLQLPESEPVLASGTLEEGKLRFNLYSRTLDVHEVVKLFLTPEDAARFSGTARQVDLTLHGSFNAPKVSGGFLLEELRYGTLTLRGCPVAAALELNLKTKPVSMKGEVLVKEGQVILKNDVVVDLQPSRFIYVGDIKKPQLDLHGTASVEKIPIHITLKGTFRLPQLKLDSFPPLPQDHLLLMLATGRRWKGMEKPAGEGGLPLDLVGQFLDYAVLGGTGGRLAQRLGLEASVLLSEEGKTRGGAVRKSIGDKMGVSYGVEQTQPDMWGAPPVTRQRVGADYQMTESDQISLEADSRIADSQTQSNTLAAPKEKEPETDSKVFLKYKRTF